MMTMALSPKRAAGLVPIEPTRTRTADATCPVRLGRQCYDVSDPCHIGALERMEHGAWAILRYGPTLTGRVRREDLREFRGYDDPGYQADLEAA